MTHFKAIFSKPPFVIGIWAGVELDNAEGKNDGTVRGRTSVTSEMVFSTLLAGEGNALLPVCSWSWHLCRCQGCRQGRSQLSAQGA